jgi:hypothetical protein
MDICKLDVDSKKRGVRVVAHEWRRDEEWARPLEGQNVYID